MVSRILHRAVVELHALAALPDFDPETWLAHTSKIVEKSRLALHRAGHVEAASRLGSLAMPEPSEAVDLIQTVLNEVGDGDAPALTVAQAAKRSGISARTLYRMVEQGTLPHTRVGSGRGSIRIKPAALDRLLEPETPPVDYLFG